MRLRGIIGPVVTTYRRGTEELDLDAFARNLRAHLDAGLHGVAVAGSTGEAALLDENERGALVETARRVVPRDRLLLAGTGAESTRTTIRLTRQAAERGADAVLVVAPHYYGSAMSPAALAAHYRRLADESPVPVVLYNIPKYAHFALSPALVKELAAHENVIGIKDSSGDVDLLAMYASAQSERFAVMTGNASTAQRALAAGARGAILAAALFAPALSLALYEATTRGDTPRAAALQARLEPLGSRIVGGLGVAGVKAALDRVGGALTGGPVRAPLLPLPPGEAAEVDRLLSEAEAPPPVAA